LPELKIPGRAPIGALPNWATFTPDGRLLYVTNSAIQVVCRRSTRKAMKVVANIPWRGAQAHHTLALR